MATPKHSIPSDVQRTDPVAPTAHAARAHLLRELPVTERRRVLAGIPSAVLEGGTGTPLVLLHGPGAYAAHWLRVLPALVRRHHVIAPDLPGHGSSELPAGELDAELVLRWLDALIAETCSEPPVLVGELLGGAIAARFAGRQPERVRRLVLVDAFGLAPFQPAPSFGRALGDFAADPSPVAHDLLWGFCAHDLTSLRQQMGALWEPFAAYNIDRARAPGTPRAVERMMADFAVQGSAEAELARITVATSLIWGRHDLATPLAVAQAASSRYGWPLHVIEGANDAPAMERPEEFARVLLADIEGPRRNPGERDATGRERVDTLVIGGGQAGLATSYWLRRAGIDHLVVDRRPQPGGGWHDRWDSFHLVAPNFCLLLPGMPYTGPYPDAFMPKSQVIEYVQNYAAFSGAPLRSSCTVERLAVSNGHFEAHTGGEVITARNVVLATGPYQRPKIPAVSVQLPPHVQQLHSQDYRRSEQLQPGGVLVVGSGQSGTQIAEELQRAGRDVHLAVSMCPSVPRRYRGRDIIWWLLNSYQNRERLRLPFPTVTDLPTPAARFGCNPHLSGNDGGHDIHLRHFARQGMHLYGKLESAAGSKLRFSDDLAQRLEFADRQFDEEFRPLFDAYIAAAGISAPPDDRPPPDDYVPPLVTELDLDAAGVRSLIWATGYGLDFSWVELPVFDDWGYPRHLRGVTEYPGLYAVGLPWLYSEPSSVFAGVGEDAEHVVKHLAEHRQRAALRSATAR